MARRREGAPDERGDVPVVLDDQDRRLRPLRAGVRLRFRPGGRPRRDRQEDPEGGSMADPGLELDRAARVLDQPGDDGEAEAGAAASPRRVGPSCC